MIKRAAKKVLWGRGHVTLGRPRRGYRGGYVGPLEGHGGSR
jgi:hypothetical protein